MPKKDLAHFRGMDDPAIVPDISTSRASPPRSDRYRLTQSDFGTRQCTPFSAASISPTRQSMVMLASE